MGSLNRGSLGTLGIYDEVYQSYKGDCIARNLGDTRSLDYDSYFGVANGFSEGRTYRGLLLRASCCVQEINLSSSWKAD